MRKRWINHELGAVCRSFLTSFFILYPLQVLLVTEMRRSESVVQPDLFQYHNHFEFLGIVGKTKFSEVFRVRHRQTKEIFAVKRSRRGFRTKLQREQCLREIRAVAALPPHPSIVGQYRAWQEGGHFYIQMDYCEGGSLHQLLYPPSGRVNPLFIEEIWAVAVNVASGLDFLHSHDVLHLDIKPENLYRNLHPNGTPGPWRIGDFGLAVAKETTDWEEGDGDYVAPELLRAGCEPSSAADIFSLGATLYECATGQKLPRKESSAEAAEAVGTGLASAACPEPLVALVQAMLLTDPLRRPNAAQIVAYANGMKDSTVTPVGNEQGGATTPEPVHPPAGPPPCLGDTGGEEPEEEEQGGGVMKRSNASSAGKRNRFFKWLPLLSPLPSEDGNLTPGAAAGLIGLTPPTNGGAEQSYHHQQQLPKEEEDGAKSPPPLPQPPSRDRTVSPPIPLHPSSSRGPIQRPPPLRLPPHQPTLIHPLSSNRTLDNSNSNPPSFRLHRRDLKSPGSDFFGAGSASESEPYSFSYDCDTGSASDLEFADTQQQPPPPSHLSRPPPPPPHPAPPPPASHPPLTSARKYNAMSIAWELQNSPDWNANANGPSRSPTPRQGEDQEEEGDNDPTINSIDSSPVGSAPVSSRSCIAGAVPRFPALDPAAFHSGSQEMVVGPLSARDRLPAPGKTTPRWPSPFENILKDTTATTAAVGTGTTCAIKNADINAAATGGTGGTNTIGKKKNSGRSGPAAVVPPLALPTLGGRENTTTKNIDINTTNTTATTNPLRRKRQHSSRRALVHALKEGDLPSSRSVDLCSSRSLQELMPVKKGARRGGTFQQHDVGDGGGGVGMNATGAMGEPASGGSTQRSARKMASSTAEPSPCSAAAAADRMTNMTLDDDTDVNA